MGNVKIANLALGLAAMCAAILVAEGLGRLLLGSPTHHPAPQVRYDPHGVRRFTLRAPQDAFTYDAPVRVDARGFRETGMPCDPAPASTIFALGDSFTFGLGVPDSAAWPARLQANLRGMGYGACVVNGGTISYGVFQEMDLLRERGLALHPRLVLHALYWNDYQSAYPPAAGAPPVLTPDGYFVWDAESKGGGVLRQAARWFTRHSTVARLLADVTQGLRQDQAVGGYATAHARLVAGTLDPREWTPVRNFYRELKALGDTAGFRVLVIIVPVFDIVQQGDPLRHPYRTYVRALLDSFDIPYVDGIEVWSRRHLGAETFLPQGQDAHLNAVGYRILADAVAEDLARTGLLDSASTATRNREGGNRLGAARQ